MTGTSPGQGASAIEQLMQCCEADACLFGLFASGFLQHEPWVICERPEDLGATAADLRDVLFGESLSGFHCAHAGVRGGGVGAVIRGALLKKERSGPLRADAVSLLEAAIASQLEQAPLERFLPNNAETEFLHQRHPLQNAMYVIDRSGTVLFRWITPNVDVSELERDGKLRAQFARPLADLQKTWDWDDPGKCAPLVLSPVDGIGLQAYPAAGGEKGICCFVMIERLKVRLSGFRTEYRLSARETDVISLLLQGRTVPEAAESLCIAETTVQYHVNNAMMKANARNRMHLAARVLGWNASLHHGKN